MSACKDCTYYRPDSMMRLPVSLTTCAHPTTAKTDLILNRPVYPHVIDQRAPGGPCGPSGALFERETNVYKHAVRGRGLYIVGAVYLGLFGTFIYKLYS